MPQNSIAACSDGIEKAKQALKRKGLSRQKLAGHKDCNLERSTIDNFFKGKAVTPFTLKDYRFGTNRKGRKVRKVRGRIIGNLLPKRE